MGHVGYGSVNRWSDGSRVTKCGSLLALIDKAVINTVF